LKRAKPFLKWAGGKTQLIEVIEQQLPTSIIDQPFTYVEPFVGSGAVLFWMIEQFPLMERAVINDINNDLTNCYKSIKKNVEALISMLSDWQEKYNSFEGDIEKKKIFYYQKRALFNTRKSNKTTQCGLFIFLNKTCYNGLYRVNKKNEYNVPIGSYKKPVFCNPKKLRAISSALQKVTILNGDYSKTLKLAGKNSFFYFDPPYKPLNTTSRFNSYAKAVFNDLEQIRLRDFCNKLNDNNHKWMLSNSDIKNIDPKDNFFDDLYANYSITRVNAIRKINSKGGKRGKITELLINN
jgi:DNA adenine methylase